MERIDFKPNLLPTLLYPVPLLVPSVMLSCPYVFMWYACPITELNRDLWAGPNLPGLGGPNLPVRTSKRVQLLKSQSRKKTLTFVPSFNLHVSHFMLVRCWHDKTDLLHINYTFSVSTGFYFGPVPVAIQNSSKLFQTLPNSSNRSCHSPKLFKAKLSLMRNCTFVFLGHPIVYIPLLSFSHLSAQKL